MNFKEAKVTIITILILTVLFAGASLSFAAEKDQSPLTVEDFQVDHPAILPGNPFYKLKGFFKNLFSEQDATTQINTYAAELLKVEEVSTSVRSKIFTAALQNYQDAIEEFSPLSDYTDDEKNLLKTLLLHLRFVEELESRIQEEKVLKVLTRIHEDLTSQYELATE